MAYITVAEFEKLTSMSSVHVKTLKSNHLDFLHLVLEQASNIIDTMLFKRYAVPFKEPLPVVKMWTAQLATAHAIKKLVVDTNNAPYLELFNTAAEEVKAMLMQVADAENGMFELPMREGSSKSGVVKPQRPFTADQSPYTALSRQSVLGSREDRIHQLRRRIV